MRSRPGSPFLIHSAVVMALLSAGAGLLLSRYAADDAYMHFRIAENFASLGRPYFNLDSPVMSTSSPLWTLLLTVLQLLSGWLTLVVPHVNAVILGSIVWVYGRLGELLCGAEPRWVGPFTGLLAAACVFGAGQQLMETPLAILFVGLGYLHYFQGRPMAFCFLTLAGLTRLECFAFLLIAAIENWSFRRVSLGRGLAASVLSAFPVAAWMLYSFGSLLPQTVVAKSAIYHLTSSEFLTLAVASYFGKFLFFGYPLIILLFFTVLTVLSIYSCLFHLHPPEYVARDRRALVLLCPALLIFLTYALARVYIFPWYAPIYTAVLVFSLACLARSKPSRILRLMVVVLCFPPLFVFLRDVSSLWSGPQRFSEFEGGLRAQAYRQAGRYLSQQCAGCSVMAAEVGGLGYEFRGPILDAAGLATPEAVQFHRQVYENQGKTLGGIIPAGFVAAAKPDFVVGLDSFLADVRGSGLLRDYEPVDWRPSYLSGEDTMRIYRRKAAGGATK